MEFEVSKTTDSDAVTITRFVAEEDAIAEIKLTTSSIVLTEEKIPFAQKLILRVTNFFLYPVTYQTVFQILDELFYAVLVDYFENWSQSI